MYGIDLPWEPGRTLCPLGVPLGVHYRAMGVLSGRQKDCVINCLIFGPVLFSYGIGGDVILVTYTLGCTTTVRCGTMAPTGWPGCFHADACVLK